MLRNLGLDYLIIKNVFLLPGDESPGKGLF